MVKIYIRKILDGKITIDDVKSLWKDEVIAMLNKIENKGE